MTKILWFTGLSGVGKSTLSKILGIKLTKLSFKVKIIDGDIFRRIRLKLSGNVITKAVGDIKAGEKLNAKLMKNVLLETPRKPFPHRQIHKLCEKI